MNFFEENNSDRIEDFADQSRIEREIKEIEEAMKQNTLNYTSQINTNLHASGVNQDLVNIVRAYAEADIPENIVLAERHERLTRQLKLFTEKTIAVTDLHNNYKNTLV